MSKFIKFAIVGTLGSITNLAVFFVLSIFGFYYMLNACVCFFVAVTQNYILNNFFTFKEKKLNLKQYLLYINANIFGLCVNLSVLFVFRNFILEQYADIFSQAIGIFAAFIINFLLSKYFVFKGNK